MNSTIQPLPVIDATMVGHARQLGSRSGKSLVAELETLSAASPHDFVRLLAAPFGMGVLDTAQMLALTPVSDVLPLSEAMQRRCALLRTPNDHRIVGVIVDPFDTDLMTWLEIRAGVPVHFCLARQADLQAYLSRQEESVRAVDSLFGAPDSATPGALAPELSLASLSQSSSPAVRLVNSTLYDALKAGASDVHLESTARGITVKYRIDGVLDNAITGDGHELAEQVISRLKVLAELDIAERRVPQDGSFRIASNGRDIDLRLSIMPSIHGEDAVIRILDKRDMVEAHGTLNLDALGFDPASLSCLRQLANAPYGMLLVTGPTGSGKTTTLYAALTEIHNGRDKIITIEDPVEYQLPGILQIPVNEKKGLTFARGLRSVLRHDPDKIMVGEIRDRETAEIAVQSALTGHMVLTTVHANNVFDVFSRFNHMGIDPYAFVSALNGIWAQRLVRLNCTRCAVSHVPDAAKLAKLNLSSDDVRDYHFLEGQGCGDCRGTGFSKRRAVSEILLLDDEVRELIIERRPIRQVKELARRNGTRTLREAALDMVRRGETTLTEIQRVTMHG